MSQEEVIEEKARALMMKRKITYQEAENLVKRGQRSVMDF